MNRLFIVIYLQFALLASAATENTVVLPIGGVGHSYLDGSDFLIATSYFPGINVGVPPINIKDKTRSLQLTLEQDISVKKEYVFEDGISATLDVHLEFCSLGTRLSTISKKTQTIFHHSPLSLQIDGSPINAAKVTDDTSGIYLLPSSSSSPETCIKIKGAILLNSASISSFTSLRLDITLPQDTVHFPKGTLFPPTEGLLYIRFTYPENLLGAHKSIPRLAWQEPPKHFRVFGDVPIESAPPIFTNCPANVLLPLPKGRGSVLWEKTLHVEAGISIVQPPFVKCLRWNAANNMFNRCGEKSTTSFKILLSGAIKGSPHIFSISAASGTGQQRLISFCNFSVSVVQKGGLIPVQVNRANNRSDAILRITDSFLSSSYVAHTSDPSIGIPNIFQSLTSATTFNQVQVTVKAPEHRSFRLNVLNDQLAKMDVMVRWRATNAKNKKYLCNPGYEVKHGSCIKCEKESASFECDGFGSAFSSLELFFRGAPVSGISFSDSGSQASDRALSLRGMSLPILSGAYLFDTIVARLNMPDGIPKNESLSFETVPGSYIGFRSMYGFNNTSGGLSIVDTDPPEISDCPKDIRGTTDLGSGFFLASWKTPKFMDHVDDTDMLTTSIFINGAQNMSTSNLVPLSFITKSFGLGENKVDFVVQDTSGNAASCTFKVFVVDLEPPSIQCGDTRRDLRINTQGIVAWVPPKVLDNSGEVNLIVRPKIEDILTPGTYIVYAHAEDSSGNISPKKCHITLQAFNCSDTSNVEIQVCGKAALSTKDLISTRSSSNPGDNAQLAILGVVLGTVLLVALLVSLAVWKRQRRQLSSLEAGVHRDFSSPASSPCRTPIPPNVQQNTDEINRDGLLDSEIYAISSRSPISVTTTPYDDEESIQREILELGW